MIYWNKDYKGNFVKSGRTIKSEKMPYIDDEDIDKFEERLNKGEEVKMKGWTFRKDDTGRISVIDPDGNLLDKDFKSVASFIDWFRYWKKDSLKSSRKSIKSALLKIPAEEWAHRWIPNIMDQRRFLQMCSNDGYTEFDAETFYNLIDKYGFKSDGMGGYEYLSKHVNSSREAIKSSLDGLNPEIICDRMREKNLDSVEDHEENLDKINAFENAWETYQKSWEIFNNKYTLADIEEMYNGLEHLLEDKDKQVVEDWIEDIDEVFFSNKPLSKMSLNYGTTGNDVIESSRKQIKQSHVADINYYKQLVKSVLSNRMTEDEALNKIAVRNNCNKKYAESIYNNWMDKYKEQLIKSDAEIADIQKEFNVDGDIYSWAEDYMPGSGKANTKGGELVRAAHRILSEYYNNGNMIGRGFGNETTNPAARYIVEKTNFDGNGEIEDMLNHLVRMDDGQYNSWCKRFESDFANYLRSNAELFEEPNDDDIADYVDENDKEFFIKKFYVEDDFGNKYVFIDKEENFVCDEVDFAEPPAYNEGDIIKDGDEFSSEIDKNEEYGTFEKDGFTYDWEADSAEDENGNYNEWKIVRVTISDQLFEKEDVLDFEDIEKYKAFDMNGNELTEEELLSVN